MEDRHKAGEGIRAADRSCFSLLMPSSEPLKDSADGSEPGGPICHGMEPGAAYWRNLLIPDYSIDVLIALNYYTSTISS